MFTVFGDDDVLGTIFFVRTPRPPRVLHWIFRKKKLRVMKRQTPVCLSFYYVITCSIYWSLLCLQHVFPLIKPPRASSSNTIQNDDISVLKYIETSSRTIFLSTATILLTLSLAALRGFGDLGRGGRSFTDSMFGSTAGEGGAWG